MLDGGSTVTIINKKLAHGVGLFGQEVDMQVRGLWGGEKHTKCERLNFSITGEFGEHKIEHALAVSHMDLPIQTLYRSTTDEINRQTMLNIEPYRNAKPLILIGQDNWRLIESLESRAIEGSGTVVSRTLLGWVVHGYCENRQDGPHSLNVHASICTLDCEHPTENREINELTHMFEQYFILENLGVLSLSVAHKGELDRATKILQETTRKVGKQWETGLLWKNDTMPDMRDTRATALRRMYAMEHRCDRDPEFAKKFYNEVNRWIEAGYAVKVDKCAPPSPIRRYLSIFNVSNPNKPGKVRPVHDAAEKTNGVSFNDMLIKGPDLLESLPGILTRFRQYPFAVIADIKDMFLRVRMIEKDRAAQTFLYRGADRSRTPDEWEMNSLIFGSKSSPTSALFVKNTNAQCFEQTKPEAAKSIIKNSYMDDYLASGSNVEKMRQMVNDAILINGEANFEFHGWGSNDDTVIADVQESNKLCDKQKANLCNAEERVLGLYWDRKADTLRFNIGLNKIKSDIATEKTRPTKREVLSVAMSVYDPLGILCPFTLNAKLIIQDIWISGVGWDSKIQDDEFATWKNWLKNLQKMTECTILRSFIPKGADYASAQLHVFCDASKVAFAAVAYLRIIARDGSTHLALVMAKARVASVKPTTTPRMELQAAVLGTRLAATIGKELDIKIDERIFWSDSAVIIHWIQKGPRTKRAYVANRVNEINSNTRANEWRWVPGELNPADDATRPKNRPMLSTDRWLIGPEFLKEQECMWPKPKELDGEELQEADKKESLKEFIGALFVAKPRSWEESAQIGKCRWNRIINVAESLRNFFQICKIKLLKKPVDLIKDSEEAKETPMQKIREAEKFWYRLIQEAYFSNELEALRQGIILPKGSKLITLRPFIDGEGILRARGRVSRVFDSKTGQSNNETKIFENEPIILDANHYATKFLIEMYHERYYHANNETVINEIRQQYYIIGLRTRLKSIAKRCVTCRVERAKPQNLPMSDLPECRTTYGHWPFSQCGIDYFGPMIVKIGRRREKRWGVLFTCMSTRAIHLELASTLSASSTIMAVQRLAARRGFPQKIFSDNGTNFVKASKELHDAVIQIDAEKQQEFAKVNRFSWNFNPPDAPHMGGAWERLIRSVKVAIHHALNDQSCTEEVLLTLLAEIEHMVNSRPLTHVSTDPDDEEALTPNHFLIGRSSGNLKLTRYESEILSPRRTFEIVQNLAQGFWKRWLREYLPTVLAQRKWHATPTPIQVDDIVVILDYQAPRNTWRKGRVVEVYPSRSDKVVRCVKIRSGKSLLVRPVHKLIKILGSSESKKSS